MYSNVSTIVAGSAPAKTPATSAEFQFIPPVAKPRKSKMKIPTTSTEIMSGGEEDFFIPISSNNQNQQWGKIVVTVPTKEAGVSSGTGTGRGNNPDEQFFMDTTGSGSFEETIQRQQLQKSLPLDPNREVAVLSSSTTHSSAIRGGIFAEEEDDSLYTEPTEAKDEFEFKNMTLDEIINFKAKAASRGPNSNLRFPGYASMDGSSEYSVDERRKPTPVTVLRMLACQGQMITMADKEIDCLDEKGARQHRWRAEWTFGEKGKGITGVGEGARKMVARQSGAMDLVEKLRKTIPVLNLPEPKIPMGCLIGPYLFTMLENVAGFPPEYQMTKTKIGRGGSSYKYTCMCVINDDIFLGKSTSDVYAKRFAAKNAYDSIAKKPYNFDPIIYGEKCFETDKFTALESETTHVVFQQEEKKETEDASTPLWKAEFENFERKRKAMAMSVDLDDNSNAVSTTMENLALAAQGNKDQVQVPGSAGSGTGSVTPAETPMDSEEELGLPNTPNKKFRPSPIDPVLEAQMLAEIEADNAVPNNTIEIHPPEMYDQFNDSGSEDEIVTGWVRDDDDEDDED